MELPSICILFHLQSETESFTHEKNCENFYVEFLIIPFSIKHFFWRTNMLRNIFNENGRILMICLIRQVKTCESFICKTNLNVYY